MVDDLCPVPSPQIGYKLYVFRSIINQDTAIPDTECQLTLDSIDLYDDSSLPLL